MAGRTRDTGLDDHLFFHKYARTYASATSFKARGLGTARVHRHCSKNLRARDLRTYATLGTPNWILSWKLIVLYQRHMRLPL